MKFSTFLPISIAAATGANALFDCNSNQHAFPPTTGKFVVHYTSIRDTEIDGEPWVLPPLLIQLFGLADNPRSASASQAATAGVR